MAKLGNLHNRNIDWVDDVFDMLALGVQVSRSANRAAQMSKLNARRLKKKLGTMNGAQEALLHTYQLALFVVYQGIQSMLETGGAVVTDPETGHVDVHPALPKVKEFMTIAKDAAKAIGERKNASSNESSPEVDTATELDRQLRELTRIA